MWQTLFTSVRSAIGALALISIFYPSGRLYGWFQIVIDAWDIYIPRLFSEAGFHLHSYQISLLIFLSIILGTFLINYVFLKKREMKSFVIGTFFIICGVLIFFVLLLIGLGYLQNGEPLNDETWDADVSWLLFWTGIGSIAVVPRAAVWIFAFAAVFVLGNEITLVVANTWTD